MSSSPNPVSAANSISEETVDLKNRNLAAVLAYLIPGAGHFYQRRWFKGLLYSVCILGTFFCGVCLGEGRSVYMSYYTFVQNGPGIQDQHSYRKRNYGYLSQVLVGLPSLPAMIQSRRFEAESNQINNYLLDLVDVPIESRFEGMLLQRTDNNQIQTLPVKGRLSLAGQVGEEGSILQGQFQGTLLESGETVELTLSDHALQTGGLPLGRPVSADPQRLVDLWVDEVQTGPENLVDANLYGSIPRSLWNWYQVPLENHQLQDLNKRLGKQWEMGMVFTWIAGLLNILAIWDAYEGPAYGIRPLEKKKDERENGLAKRKQDQEDAEPAEVV